MAVEARLRDEQPQPGAEFAGGLCHGEPHRLEGGAVAGADAAADARRRAVLAKRVAQDLGPLAGGDPGTCAGKGGLHEIAVGRCVGGERGQGEFDRGGVSCRAPGLQ